MEKKISEKIMEYVGGKGNINSVSHCATRLRVDVKDASIVKRDKIEGINGVYGCNVIGNECQIIIGTDVADYYAEMNKMLSNITPSKKKNKNIGYALLDYIAGTMTPLIPVLIGASVIRGILILLTQFNLMDGASSTYAILYAASNAIFYFLPIFASFSAAKKLDVNPFIAACISATLMEPTFTSLLTETGNIVSFMGLPVMMFSYSASLIPALLSTWIYSLLWKVLDKYVPSSISTIVNPALSLVICVPFTAIVFGPIAYYFGQFVGNAFNTINALSPIIAGIFIGVSMNYLVITGMHWVITAICIVEFSTNGFSALFGYWWCACISYIAIALGAIFVAKNKSERNLAVSCSVVAIFGGVSEPTLYSYLLRNKRYAIPMAISGAIAGGLAGLLGCKATAFSMATIFTVPCVEMGGSFLNSIWVFAVAIAAGIISTIVFVGKSKAIDFDSPMSGEIVGIENVKDATFASKVLGDGFAIIPSEGKVYAPFDCEVSSLYPTNHAIGLKDKNNNEVLIHVGLNSVDLKGEGFIAKVSQGQTVKKGDLLLEFDINLLKEKGIDITSPIVFIKKEKIDAVENKSVKANELLLKL